MVDQEARAHDLAIAFVTKANPLKYQAASFEDSCELICADYNRAYNYFMSHPEEMTEKR